MIALFSCTEIEENKWWITDELDIRCWDDEHMWYLVHVSIPALIVWGLSVPIMSLFLILKNRNRRFEEVIKLKYGFLFLGYDDGSFYWEFVIMSRKVTIAFISVFLESISVTV